MFTEVIILLDDLHLIPNSILCINQGFLVNLIYTFACNTTIVQIKVNFNYGKISWYLVVTNDSTAKGW